MAVPSSDHSVHMSKTGFSVFIFKRKNFILDWLLKQYPLEGRFCPSVQMSFLNKWSITAKTAPLFTNSTHVYGHPIYFLFLKWRRLWNGQSRHILRVFVKVVCEESRHFPKVTNLLDLELRSIYFAFYFIIVFVARLQVYTEHVNTDNRLKYVQTYVNIISLKSLLT